MRASTPILLVSLAIFVSACSVSFPPEEIVEKDRPLVGRVVVVGDETRSTPGPGETARYEFLVASPGVQPGYSYLFVACPWCNPDGLGYGSLRDAYAKKRADAAMRRLLGVIDPGALTQPETAAEGEGSEG